MRRHCMKNAILRSQAAFQLESERFLQALNFQSDLQPGHRRATGETYFERGGGQFSLTSSGPLAGGFSLETRETALLAAVT